MYAGRDFTPKGWADLRLATVDDACPRCGATSAYELHRGIEVGHVFFLGTKYSAAMDCSFLDEGGKEQPAIMGCYGIGVSRIMAAAVEQSHDDNGIIWPMPLAPYQVVVMPLNMNDEAVVSIAEDIYNELSRRGVEVLIDDRKERPGGKFKDADLVGIPYQVVVGKRSLKDGTIEVKRRGQEGREDLPIAEAAEGVYQKVREELAQFELAEDWEYDPTA